VHGEEGSENMKKADTQKAKERKEKNLLGGVENVSITER
jgi:hypothetical protein